MTALKMTVDEALALADQWCAGLTMDADSKGWGAILLVLAEEVRRLRAENERLRADAERYRFLAKRCRSTSEHWGGRWSVVIDGPAPASHNSEDDFDAAIDAAMEASNAG